MGYVGKVIEPTPFKPGDRVILHNIEGADLVNHPFEGIHGEVVEYDGPLGDEYDCWVRIDGQPRYPRSFAWVELEAEPTQE